MRIFISTGEVSGDLQGAMLVNSLYRIAQEKNLDLEIAGLGGDRMKAAGVKILANTASIGSMGFLEALPFVIPTLKIQTQAQRYLQQNPPDILILIDYPTSNLALAGYVKQHLPHVPVVYYIAPQDWAVPMLNNTSKIAKVVDKLFAVFPAEAEYFASKNLDVTWVGHPLLDRMATAPSRATARQTLGIEAQQQIITLLPASRQQELKYLLPEICQAAQQIQAKLTQVHFLIPVSLPIYRQAIATAVQKYNLSATILPNNTLEAIAAADLAITKSGTVNLEIALLNVPQVVVYRLHPLTAWIARKILGFSIPLMSPPNLVLDREIVPELKQEQVTAANITQQALQLLSDTRRQQQLETEYQQMRSRLGKVGVCDRTAREVMAIAESRE